MNVIGLKKFFASSLGRVVMTVMLYFIIFGIMLVTLPLFGSTVAVITAIAFIWFGWRALSKITPQIFLIMPVAGWIVYFVIKGVLSLFLGVFVAPFIIGKGLSTIISKSLKNSLKNDEIEKNT